MALGLYEAKDILAVDGSGPVREVTETGETGETGEIDEIDEIDLLKSNLEQQIVHENYVGV